MHEAIISAVRRILSDAGAIEQHDVPSDNRAAGAFFSFFLTPCPRRTDSFLIRVLQIPQVNF